MLAFFPHPYPDELLYSVFARYHRWSGNVEAKTTLRELFGSVSASAVIDLPSHLQVLMEALPVGAHYDLPTMIHNHTMFPLYATFMPQNRSQQVFQAMSGNKDTKIYQMTGIIASTVSLFSALRFCPECVKSDQVKFGETYWHRIHQFPGILVCPIHQCATYDSLAKIHANNKHVFVAATEDVCKISYEAHYIGSLKEKLLKVAKEIDWLLQQNNPITFADIREDYLFYLKQKELLYGNYRVDQKAFENQFQDFYGLNTLQLLQSNVDYSNESCWLKSIVRKQRKLFHPLRHILVMVFLAGSIASFLDKPCLPQPFGKGPWPCLNPAAKHYQKNVVEKIKVTRCCDTGKPVGTFTCSCGFIYSRRGPDQLVADRLRIGRIKQFGWEWEEKLRYLVEKEKLGMRETARKIQADANTIKKYAAILGLVPFWQQKKAYVLEKDKKTDAQKAVETILSRYRKDWINVQQRYPEKFCTFLREKAPKIYVWLYRHDCNWLQKHSPYSHKAIISKRVDWENRDQEMLIKVQKVVRTLKEANNEKPVRVTICQVGKRIGELSILQKKLYKMPNTCEYLKDNVETTEQFQLRRIHWAVHILSLNNSRIKSWQITRKAGLNAAKSKKFHAFIDNLLN